MFLLLILLFLPLWALVCQMETLIGNHKSFCLNNKLANMSWEKKWWICGKVVNDSPVVCYDPCARPKYFSSKKVLFYLFNSKEQFMVRWLVCHDIFQSIFPSKLVFQTVRLECHGELENSRLSNPIQRVSNLRLKTDASSGNVLAIVAFGFNLKEFKLFYILKGTWFNCIFIQCSKYSETYWNIFYPKRTRSQCKL